jgi:hypothetical protein
MLRSLLACAGAAVLLAGCSRQTPRPVVTYKMGETARVGPLSYTVTEAEWFDQLGEGAAARLPKNRFLAVRLTVTNGGAQRSAIPPAELVDTRGETHPEVDAAELGDWFGTFRGLDPAQSDHGRLVFDVPSGAYRLRVAEDADPDQQSAALIELPYQSPALMPRSDRAIPASR